MPIPKNLKSRIQKAIEELERRKLKNNYFITEDPDSLQNIPERSLVVITTPYPEKVAETGSD